ncbi:MAG TPA: phosphonate C-P lyase system protein PhnH [Ramlibacter sp.]|nr:phosphonate C-P lyase system protein PhnH [Ramlibacter sp.]
MSSGNTLRAGFQDPVHDAQQSFRDALDALSRPGRPQALGRAIAGLPLGAALSHLLLALTDEDTRVWWQHPDEALAHWLRFHTGARAVQHAAQADFAVITDSERCPPLEGFAIGSAASPEMSTTLLIEVPSLVCGPSLHWHGPGIRDRQAVRIDRLPAGFWPQWQANHAMFPQGVDVIFTCSGEALGLPRTTRVSRLEGV